MTAGGETRDAAVAREAEVAAHVKLADALLAQDKPDEAEARYRLALALAPGNASLVNRLGNALYRQGRLEQSIQQYRQALALKPDSAGVHYNLGNALVRRGKWNEAAAHYIRAVALKPDFADAHYGLSGILSRQGHLENAIAALRRALKLNPDFVEAEMQLAMLRMQACDWSRARDDVARALVLMHEHPGITPPANMLALPVSAADQLLCARQWAGNLMRGGAPPVFHHSRPASAGKIRLGYLCADYYDHPLARLIVEMIERHDRSTFVITAYSIGRDDESGLRKRLEAAFDRLIDLRTLDDAPAASRIYEDGTDIAIDLTGYAQNARTRILAARPAPVQVNGIGYTGTMGASFLDYIIADPFVAPMDQQPFFSERLVHLPHCYLPSDSRREPARRSLERRDCGLPVDGFVFCCFNTRYKLRPHVFDTWMRLLHAVPGSVLWLLENTPSVRENLRAEAHRRGIGSERLVFTLAIPLPDFLARLRLADLFLDTLPYNAHTTANDALWAGLPVLTCAGATFAGRVAGSQLRTLGLPELVTGSLEEYEMMAIRLARIPALLDELRRRLAQNRLSSPLFDMAQYTRGLEAAYSRMFETWCRGEEPRSFAV
ncbi:MAG TPA: tetratricopeptide repeat protein [Stellaceae bacterium]|nr:tetratricopeptide repeat protein [Stellaceae bacterium]